LLTNGPFQFACGHKTGHKTCEFYDFS